MRQYRFYKEQDVETGFSTWFIDLKYFPFNKAWLALIDGAHELLDLLSNDKDEVTLELSTAPIPYSDGVLEKKYSSLTGGAIYNADNGYIKHGINPEKEVWLCPATLWVFLRYPKKIHFKIVD